MVLNMIINGENIRTGEINIAALKRKMAIDPRLRPLLIFPKDMIMLRSDMMLWRTVLIQAMRDALGGCVEAKLWFCSPSFKDDLETVCELAGVNLKYILEIMLEVQDKKIKCLFVNDYHQQQQ